MNSTLPTQVGQLARRSVIRTLRQPAQIVPSLIFPMFLLAVNSGGLKSVTSLPGFPTDSYLTFALAITFMQGALFSVINSGTDLARDIETGFLNRMALTPLRGAALLSGLLAGSLMLGLMQALAYLIVGLAFGAELTAGVGGFFVIIALSVTMGNVQHLVNSPDLEPYSDLSTIIPAELQRPVTRLALRFVGIVFAFVSSSFSMVRVSILASSASSSPSSFTGPSRSRIL